MIARTLRQLVATSPSQWLLRTLVAVGAFGFTGALLAAGDVQTWGLWVLAALAAATVAAPHTDTGFIVILYLMGVWFSGVEQPATFCALPAALSLLLVHVSCALAAASPVGADIPATTLRRWGLRTLLVAGATGGAWLLGAAIGTGAAGAGGSLLGVLGVLVIAAAVALGYLVTVKDRSSS